MIGARSWTGALVLSLSMATLAVGDESDQAAIEHWVRELSSRDADARRAAAHGLGLAGRDATGAADALVTLVEDPEPSVRLEALRALVAIRAQGEAVAVAAWRSQARDDDADVRKQASRLTRKLSVESPAVAQELRRSLASEHADARETAVSRLARGERTLAGDIDRLLVLVLDDEDEGVRSAAVDALEALDAGLTKHQAAVLARLDARDDAMRLRAAKLLSHALPFEPATVRELTDALLTAESSRLRRTVLERLADHGRASPALAAKLLAEIEGARDARREAAILGLGLLGTGSREEIDTLLRLRLDRDSPRGAALKALVQLCETRSALPHVAAWLSSPVGSGRVAAAEVLAGFGAEARSESATLVRLAAEDPDEEVRSAALSALAPVAGAAEARPVLEAALNDRSSEVRSTARVQLAALKRAEEIRLRRSR